MQRTKWGILAATALVASGAVVVATGMFSGARAAVGDCTASPTPTTTSSSSTTTSTTIADQPQQAEPVIVTAAGNGGGPHVQIFTSDAVIGSFYAYDPHFSGGVHVAAGDMNGDGYDDIITAAGPGGGPHVRIFNGAPGDDGNPLLNELGGFMAYDPHFTGGVDVAVGDVNGDGHPDIITGAGPGGGPHVREFDGTTVVGATPTYHVLHEFMAYSQSFTGGVSVAAADMGGGDDAAEIVTGAGPGGGPHVRVLEPDGSDMAGTGGGFMAFGGAFSGGLAVAANCTDGVARIGVGNIKSQARFAIYAPDGATRDPGLQYNPDDPTRPTVDVAFGVLDDSANPRVQLVTSFGGGDDGDEPQVAIWQLPTSNGNPDGFDAYDVVVPMNVTVANL